MVAKRNLSSSAKKTAGTRVKKATKAISRKRQKTESKSQKNTSITSKKQGYFSRIQQQVANFRARRPHRSFTRTRRRDYVRSLELPGYISMTIHVFRVLKRQKKTYTLLVFVLAVMSGLLVGIASQDTYSQLSNLLNQAGKSLFTDGWGEIGKALLLLGTGVQGSLSPQLSEAQQVYAFLLFLVTWLTTVWLLRAQLAGKKPRVRDGLYNAGAPILATAFIALLFILQLVPMALAIVLYIAALNSGLMSLPLLSLLITIGGLLLIILSLYLIVSSFFALIIVTLPGMYPWQALRTASDLVTGRRLRILYRLIWLVLVVIVIWMLVMIPIILFSARLQTSINVIAGLPIIPIILLLLSTATTVYCSSYVYLFYRKVINDDTNPV